MCMQYFFLKRHVIRARVMVENATICSRRTLLLAFSTACVQSATVDRSVNEVRLVTNPVVMSFRNKFPNFKNIYSRRNKRVLFTALPKWCSMS